jgi:hypothetical protein
MAGYPNDHSRDFVVMLRSDHADDRIYVENVGDFFHRAGIGFVDLEANDLLDPDDKKSDLYRIVRRKERLLCVISLCAYGVIPRLSGQLLHEYLGVPLVVLLIDDPSFYTELVDGVDVRNVILAVQEEAFGRSWYELGYGSDIHVNLDLALGRSPRLADLSTDYEGFCKRTYPAIWDANFTVHGDTLEAIARKIDDIGEPLRGIIWRMIDRILEEPEGVLPNEVLDEVTPLVRIDDPVQKRHLVSALIWRIQSYVKLYHRQHVFHEIKNLPVLMLGRGHPEYYAKMHRDKIRAASMAETMEIYKYTRIVINNFIGTSSLHPRVLNAIFAGAAVLTQPNRRLRQLLRDRNEAFYYNFRPGELRATLAALIDDPQRCFEATVAARRVLETERFYDRCYAAILEAVYAWWEASAPPAPARQP